MDPEVLALFVPIIGIIAGAGVAIAAMVTNSRQRLQRAELRHRERLAALDKGIELPPDPPEETTRRREPGEYLRKGLVLLLIGAAVTAALWQSGHERHAFYGLIPAAVGLAYTIFYVVQSRSGAARAGSMLPPPDTGGP